MKKSLIALAALASVAGVAQAQSTVTVYGVLDVGYGDNTKKIDGVQQGQKALAFNNFSSSRFGLKGTEDLGAGLKAGFTIETGISSNTTTGSTGYLPGTTTAPTVGGTTGTTIDATTMGGRELNATISFPTGTDLKAGFGSTAVRDIVLAYDAGNGSNAVGNILVNDTQFSSNRATQLYLSQTLGGLKFGAGLAQNTTTQDGKNDTKANGYSVAAQYTLGAFSAAAAYQNSKTATNAVAAVANTGTLGTGVLTLGSAAVAAVDKNVKTTIVGASYDLGVAKLFAEYGEVKTENNTAAVIAGEGKRSGTSVGVQVPVGKFTPYAQFSTGKVDQAQTAASAASRESRDYKGYSVGTKYDLSKRTYAYLHYGDTKLDAGSVPATNGKEVKNTQTTVGVVHNF